MKTIYVVMGTTGEYSDRTEWPVLAYLSKPQAEEHVEKASARARELFALRGGRYMTNNPEVNEHDPSFTMDYTGTTYYVMPVNVGEP